MSDAPVTMKTGSISGQTMHTREKIGNLCKRLLCSIVENKKSSQSIKEVATVIGGDSRKVVDLVFILESLGLITRILKNTFVYTGFRGMIQRFLEFAQYKVKKSKAYDQNSRLMTEDVSIGGKGIPIKSSIYLGKFVSVIVWTALLDTNKKISRGEVDTIFEEYSQYFKDSSSATKSIVNDMINLLIALNFFEKNELNDSLAWSGPDCINSVGLTNDNVYDIDNLPDVIKPKRNINYDSREYTYFKNLLKDEIASNKIVLKAENFSWSSPNEESFVKDPNSSLNLYPLSSFEQGGYALLKGKTWQYLMTKPCAIIGRLPNNKDTANKKYKWEVDVDLVNSPSVSRQHAVILYNYEEETFEIKCLSKKNPVKVGDFIYDSKDKACPLESKTLVTLGGESFYFYLPNLPSEKIEEDKQDKKEEKDKNDEEGSGKEEEEDKEEDKEAKEDDEDQIKGDDEREGEEEEGEEGAKKMEEEEDDVDDEDEEEEGDDEGDGEGEGMETE